MKDKLVKYRLYVFWDYDKEEEWLGRMAEEGYGLEDACFCRYIFRKGKPGAWRYKMEFLEHHPSTEKGREYLDFLEETGIEVVCTYLRWAYLRQPAERGEFELFSDLASKIRYLKRLIWFFLPLAATNLVLGLVNLLEFSEGNWEIGLVNLLIALLFCWGMRRTFRLFWKLKKQQDLEE